MKLILEAIKSLFRKIEAQRTHWEERVEVVVFPETNVTIYENNGYELLSEEHPQLVVGDKYIVLLNGARYECVAEWDEVWSCVILGDSTVDDGSVSGNNEPFYIDSYGDGEIYLNVATAGEYTISILHEATIVHPLDEKYLPESVNEKISDAQSIAEEAHELAQDAWSGVEQLREQNNIGVVFVDFTYNEDSFLHSNKHRNTIYGLSQQNVVVGRVHINQDNGKAYHLVYLVYERANSSGSSTDVRFMSCDLLNRRFVSVEPAIGDYADNGYLWLERPQEL